MPVSLTPRAPRLAPPVNVAVRLTMMSAGRSSDAAVVVASGRGYRTCSFGDLETNANALARGLVELGVAPGMRIALLVPPGVEFVTLVFALLRSGATTILVDPGMGRKHLVDCLAGAEPEGFIAVRAAQAFRILLRRKFPRARLNVTVGRRWFWGGAAYRRLLERGRASATDLPATRADDPAAIIFTSGSTGPPKGVLYTHGMFETQVREIQRQYGLQPGGVDLACFALFGLFNAAMGVTTVFPKMDFSRPASADPKKLLAAANRWRVTQAFASPAVWDNLSRHCERTGAGIPTLRKVFSCGAAVPAAVLRRTLTCVCNDSIAQMHTPYGATEALPVSTIEAHEVLGETASKTDAGAGVCVGRKFGSIDWRVIRINDKPISTIDDAEELPAGEIGELVVRGMQVSPAYEVAASRTGRLSDQSEGRANAASKLRDGDALWHRMGDVGYLDDGGRFWYCGRKSQRVETVRGALFTECVEAVFNQHPAVRRCALVGYGLDGEKTPVLVVESSRPELRENQTRQPSARVEAAWQRLVAEMRELAAGNEQASTIGEFLFHRSLPVDVRHNAKINREALAAWAVGVIADHKLRPHRDRRMLSAAEGAIAPHPGDAPHSGPKDRTH